MRPSLIKSILQESHTLSFKWQKKNNYVFTNLYFWLKEKSKFEISFRFEWGKFFPNSYDIKTFVKVKSDIYQINFDACYSNPYILHPNITIEFLTYKLKPWWRDFGLISSNPWWHKKGKLIMQNHLARAFKHDREALLFCSGS